MKRIQNFPKVSKVSHWNYVVLRTDHKVIEFDKSIWTRWRKDEENPSKICSELIRSTVNQNMLVLNSMWTKLSKYSYLEYEERGSVDKVKLSQNM